MTTNRLAKAETDQPKRTLHESCEHANAQLVLKGVNEDRQREGLPPVRWVIRDKQVKIENA